MQHARSCSLLIEVCIQLFNEHHTAPKECRLAFRCLHRDIIVAYLMSIAGACCLSRARAVLGPPGVLFLFYFPPTNHPWHQPSIRSAYSCKVQVFAHYFDSILSEWSRAATTAAAAAALVFLVAPSSQPASSWGNACGRTKSLSCPSPPWQLFWCVPLQVFRSNEASLRLWRGLGFTELAVVPKAGRLKGIEGLVS